MNEQRLNKLFKLLEGKTNFYVRDYYQEFNLNPDNLEELKLMENTINFGKRYEYFLPTGKGYFDITKLV